MPTRSILPGTPCFLGSCAICIHFNVLVTPLCYLAAMPGGAPPPPHPAPTQFTFLLLRYWLPRAKLCCFSAKSDRCTGSTRRSDGPRRYKLASMTFNTLRETTFLRMPRSYRVAEKSDPIDRFSGPNLQKFTKNRWFLSNFSTTRHDRAKRRKTHLANVSKGRLPIL